MANAGAANPLRFVQAIRASGKSIYDPITVGDPDLWIPAPELQALLDNGLRGVSLNYPIRTRSKIVKSFVCELLGYPIPASFTKVQPRFSGQQFDTYVQKANNLQVWNEGLSSSRRYVLIRPDQNGIVTRVKVVTGDSLALLDTTGTLTKKYQARCIPGLSPTELVTKWDTNQLRPLMKSDVQLAKATSPVEHPQPGQMLSIASIYERLSSLVGKEFRNAGHDQERNRGADLHRLACLALGYSKYQDDGQFPDVRHQLLELKLQTSPTIDLGVVRPDSTEALDTPMLHGKQIRHCDVRYAIFYASIVGNNIRLTHLFLSTGEGFFSRFPQFQGKVLNAKIQMHLPADFFET